VAIYSTFLQRAYDQVLHDVCLQNLPVVFALDRAALSGMTDQTHHGLFDFSYLRSIPNLTVMAPRDEAELRDMLKTAVSSRRRFPSDTPEERRRGSSAGAEIDRYRQSGNY